MVEFSIKDRGFIERACNIVLMLEFNNMVCFIFMVFIYVSDIEFFIYVSYKIFFKIV